MQNFFKKYNGKCRLFPSGNPRGRSLPEGDRVASANLSTPKLAKKTNFFVFVLFLFLGGQTVFFQEIDP